MAEQPQAAITKSFCRNMNPATGETQWCVHLRCKQDLESIIQTNKACDLDEKRGSVVPERIKKWPLIHQKMELQA